MRAYDTLSKPLVPHQLRRAGSVVLDVSRSRRNEPALIVDTTPVVDLEGAIVGTSRLLRKAYKIISLFATDSIELARTRRSAFAIHPPP